jgi:transcriptional regulator with XRE-family HTH domain
MNRIKEVLDRKGIKQTWLAEQFGKSYNMVNSYVQNRQQPRLEVLNDIAKILDVDVVELIVSSKKNEKEKRRIYIYRFICRLWWFDRRLL